jgi:hypothetical protein
VVGYKRKFISVRHALEDVEMWLGRNPGPEGPLGRRDAEFQLYMAVIEGEVEARLRGVLIVPPELRARLAALNNPPYTLPPDLELSVADIERIWWPEEPTGGTSGPAGLSGKDVESAASDVDPYRTGAPGRPSVMHLIEQEFDRRSQAGETRASLKEEARVLAAWAQLQLPRDAPRVTTKTIENRLRQAFRRSAPKPAPK